MLGKNLVHKLKIYLQVVLQLSSSTVVTIRLNWSPRRFGLIEWHSKSSNSVGGYELNERRTKFNIIYIMRTNIKEAKLVAERGEAQLDFTPLFTDLQADNPQKNDGVLDLNNMPFSEEPACIINELNLFSIHVKSI